MMNLRKRKISTGFSNCLLTSISMLCVIPREICCFFLVMFEEEDRSCDSMFNCNKDIHRNAKYIVDLIGPYCELSPSDTQILNNQVQQYLAEIFSEYEFPNQEEGYCLQFFSAKRNILDSTVSHYYAHSLIEKVRASEKTLAILLNLFTKDNLLQTLNQVAEDYKDPHVSQKYYYRP